MSLFERLVRDGLLRPLDHALAQALRRLDAGRDTADAVLAGAALASRAVGEGHAAFDPAQAARIADAPWPAPTEWEAAWRASAWIACPPPDEAAPATPLVLERGLLYLRRYREYERRLAAALRRCAARPLPAPDAAALQPVLRALFPHARADDAQALAATRALQRALLLVTGGPGTGKTTTIARVLLLLVAQARLAGEDVPRIALAAPTGRAAERMAASLRAATEGLRRTVGIDPAWCDALPDRAQTLHRLLGVIPDSPRFRHDAAHPLAYDTVVVDEASMVDLPLMCKLAEAVADGARLVLLGDPDQLPSVEAGDVLAAIVDAAGEEPMLSALDAALLGVPAPPATDDLFAAQRPRAALAGHRVHLRRAYRQEEALQLAPLAEAVRSGDPERALALLRAGTLGGIAFHADAADPLVPALRETLLAPWRELLQAADPAAALALADRARVLTALREGPQGAGPLNARIEDALAGVQREPYFHGRLLLVTANSARQGLSNGDIGVCLRDDTGAMVAWFAGSAGPRGFHPATLPAHGGAFAMTVHKAQGSEYDSAWLVLPRVDARPLTRELVYTALTRARRALHLCADEDVLRAALPRRVERVSGLRWRLDEPF
ncbi:MAG TPA: exodeoxyribonuclease V subunit alpha [Xanthomonadaceae bacterium]|nr:exodeoxyribonuclease V subunit alpha [Xanthomonadaceae bacterium]